MFKFNFGNEKEDCYEKGNTEEDILWYECRKIDITLSKIEELKKVNKDDVVTLNYAGNITLSCIKSSNLLERLKHDHNNSQNYTDILEAEMSHSDLIPGKYEGGVKIWECTGDLVNYLIKNNVLFNKKNVLDLGCGAGILGIFALLKGASVTFQDYNHEVLDLVTMPNVFLNFSSFDIFDNTQFFCGDWSSFLNVISQNEGLRQRKEESVLKEEIIDGNNIKFDYILTSETIYNSDNYDKIFRIITELMADDGTCYVAAKKCYFGVGGNTQSFLEYLSRGCLLNVERSWSSEDGVAREILKIGFRK